MNETSPVPNTAHCDHYLGCTIAPAWECACARCARETPDERYRACVIHQDEVAAQHLRVRDRSAEWKPFRCDPPPAPFAKETVSTLVRGIAAVLTSLATQFPWGMPTHFCRSALDAVAALSDGAPGALVGIAKRPAIVSAETMSTAWQELMERARKCVIARGGHADAVRASLDALAAVDNLWAAGVRAMLQHQSEADGPRAP